MSEVKEKIGEMFLKGMKQVEIAEELGYSKQYISQVIKEKNYKYLRGAKYINPKELNIDTIAVLRYIIIILMEGRTFYDGYFDVPFEELSRIDKVTLLLLNLLKEIDTDEVQND